MPSTRARLREQLNHTVHLMQEELQRRGFNHYREAELLHPETRRHVRVGYASNEWTITTGDLPQGGYGGVAQMKMLNRGQIRLDVRRYERGEPMPSFQELVTLVQQ